MLKKVIAGCILIGLSLVVSAQSREDDTPEKLLPAITRGNSDTMMVNLLLRLSRYYVLKQGELANDLDSSELLANQAMALSTQLHYVRGIGRSYINLGQVYSEKRHKKESMESLNTAIKILKEGNYLKDLGDACQELAWKYSIENEELTERIRLLQMALASFREAGSKAAESNALKELGELHLTGNPALSVQELKAALAIYDQSHDSAIEIAGIYNLLGSVSRQLGNNTDGLKYGLLSLKLLGNIDSVRSGPWLTVVCNRLAATYKAIRNFKEALHYGQMALHSASECKDTPAIRNLSGVIASVYLAEQKYQAGLDFYWPFFEKYPPVSESEKLLSCYILVCTLVPLKQLTRAKPYYLNIVSMNERIDRHSYNYTLVGKPVNIYLLATGQYSKMLPYLKNSDTLLKEILKIPRLISDNEFAWFKMDSSLGNYRSAIVHLNKHIFIEDSLHNEARRQERELLQVQYETETKDKDIQLKEQNILLLTKQGQLEHSRLEQTQTRSRLVLGGAIALLLLMGLGYNRYRLKQRSNRQLEAQQLEINKKNGVLQELLTEKEWFIKEIHHRVKNNLQIVMSLLNIQSAHLDSDSARLVLKESQQRMYAMSLIHQKLYQSDNVAFIAMPDYIRELVNYLKDSLDVEDRILFQLTVEPIDFDVSQAVPVGLILNEAITNSIKHAFTQSQHGVIAVALSRVQEDQLLLTIKDNGVGLPANYSTSTSKSLGMSLMRVLTRQLDGEFGTITDHGLMIAIRFKEDRNLKLKVA